MITGFASHDPDNTTDTESTICQLIELGLARGTRVQITHKSPFGESPMAVMANCHLVGIGAKEGELILVEKCEGS